MPLLNGAASKAIIAHLPLRQRQELAARSVVRNDGQTEACFAQTLRAIRRDGIAVAHGEVTPGIVGTAAPVFDAGGGAIASLCLSMEAAAYAGLDPDALAAALRAATKDISAAMVEGMNEGADQSQFASRIAGSGAA